MLHGKSLKSLGKDLEGSQWENGEREKPVDTIMGSLGDILFIIII